mgnify:CR=1 FL=1
MNVVFTIIFPSPIIKIIYSYIDEELISFALEKRTSTTEYKLINKTLFFCKLLPICLLCSIKHRRSIIPFINIMILLVPTIIYMKYTATPDLINQCDTILHEHLNWILYNGYNDIHTLIHTRRLLAPHTSTVLCKWMCTQTPEAQNEAENYATHREGSQSSRVGYQQGYIMCGMNTLDVYHKHLCKDVCKYHISIVCYISTIFSKIPSKYIIEYLML